MIPSLETATNRDMEPTRVGPPPHIHLDGLDAFWQYQVATNFENGPNSRQIDSLEPLAGLSRRALASQFRIAESLRCVRERVARGGMTEYVVRFPRDCCLGVLAEVCEYDAAENRKRRECGTSRNLTDPSGRRRQNLPSVPYENCGSRGV